MSRDDNMESPGLADRLEVMAHRMTDAELRAKIAAIRGSRNHRGSRLSLLSPGEALALDALMVEEARRSGGRTPSVGECGEHQPLEAPAKGAPHTDGTPSAAQTPEEKS